MKDGSSLIEVKIGALIMDPNTNTPIVVLKGIDSDTVLPIWVGAFEANAIALEIEKVERTQGGEGEGDLRSDPEPQQRRSDPEHQATQEHNQQHQYGRRSGLERCSHRRLS